MQPCHSVLQCISLFHTQNASAEESFQTWEWLAVFYTYMYTNVVFRSENAEI